MSDQWVTVGWGRFAVEDGGETKSHALRRLGTMPSADAVEPDGVGLGIGGGEGTRRHLRRVLGTIAARR